MVIMNDVRPYKNYIAKMKRKVIVPGLPRTVYKVGITASSDAMKRLMYTGPDEANPISGTFDEIKIMHSVWSANLEEAEKLEKLIMDTIANGGRFHNWFEPKQLSGITEMRVWNYDEFLKCIDLMNKHGKSFEEANRLANMGNLLETF
jgi:hypothetical protein